jgi:hypothetical protein
MFVRLFGSKNAKAGRVKLALLVAAAVAAGGVWRFWQRSDSGKAEAVGRVSVSGEKAVARLKAKGQYGSLMQAMEASRYGLQPVKREKGYFAQNPANGFNTRFTSRGVRVSSGGNPKVQWEMALRLRAVGAGNKRKAVAEATPAAANSRPDCNRVAYRRGDVTEWYENRKDGLEQGFVLAKRPEGAESGELVSLALSVEGDLRTRQIRSDEVSFVTTEGQKTIGYKDLKVVDAEGKALPARMEAREKEILLAFDDSAARYPVTVDPLVYTEAKLLPSVSAGHKEARFGYSVSVDGDTVVAGVPFDWTDAGARAGSALCICSQWEQLERAGAAAGQQRGC